MEFWPVVGPQIERALKHDGGFYSLGDIKRYLLQEKMLLWLIYVKRELIASGVTQLAEYPQKKALLVVTVGGKDFWVWAESYIKALERYRIEIGADCLLANCRPGMAKWLNKLNWTPIVTVMENKNVKRR